MGNFLRDIRYGLRQLRLSPGFTATALLTLALAVGANTAIFSLIHSVMLKSLPVGNPAQLYRIGDNDNCCVWGGLQDDWGIFSYRFYQDLRQHTPEFESIAAMQSWGYFNLSVRPSGSSAPAQSSRGEYVSGNYFSTLGIPAYIGRTFTLDDDRDGAAPAVMLSYRIWQQRFGADPALVGKTLVVDGNVFTVVGVTPPSFFGDRIQPNPPDFWVPLSVEPMLRSKSSILKDPREAWLCLIGRLRPGVSPASVQAKVLVELRQFLSAEPQLTAYERNQIPKQTLRIAPGGGGISEFKDEYKQGLYMLMAASALVLLIGCANLANLLLARAAARRVHTTIQLALGASGRRLVRAMLTETVLLAVAGGALGLLVAYSASRVILLTAFRRAEYIPFDQAISWPVLGFTFAISVLTGILFGVVPAWISTRSNPADALRGASRSTQDHSALPQKSLVVVQAALSLVLLAAAGLVTQSLRNLQNQSYGFDRSGRYLAQIDPQSAGIKLEQLPALYQRMDEDLRRIPGVRDVALGMYAPQSNDSWNESVFVEGEKVDPNAPGRGSSWIRVSPHYFETLGIPILRGRSITEQDTQASRHIAVVNQAFAKKFFPNQDPIGHHFGKDESDHAGDYEIVGIAGDVKMNDPSRPPGRTFFVPLSQHETYLVHTDQQVEDASQYMSSIVLEVAGRPTGLEEQVRRTLSNLNPDLALLSFASYDQQIEDNLGQQSLISRLTALFSGLALLLASVGLYGVTAYRVARRTGEIGLRMALGANPRDVMALVLRGAFSQIGIGLLIGVPLAIGAGRLLASKLYGIHGYDPLVLGGAIVVLGICALLACAAPARRAAMVQPMEALRTE